MLRFPSGWTGGGEVDMVEVRRVTGWWERTFPVGDVRKGGGPGG